MKSNRLRRCLVHTVVLLLGAANVAAESPAVHIEYQAPVDETGGLRYVLAEGTMSGTVRGDATYTVPVQIHYPPDGGNGTAVLELTNSALLFFHLRDRGDRPGDRRSDADDLDELESMLVNFGWAGAREYLLRNGFTHMAVQHSKAVTDFMGETRPEGRVRRRLCYGHIEKATDVYEIVRDAARWLAAPGALTGDALPVPPHDHVIAYGLSGTGYFLRDYLIRSENAGREIDGFFVHAAGSKCLAPIDDTAECPEGAICIGSPRFSHWFTCPGPPPTNGAKVLAVDAQSDLEFNAGALAREGAVDDPDYVRWEVAGAPHVPVFAMDLTRLGAPHQNPMDWSPIWRSAIHYLDRWVKHGTAPPTAPPIEGRWEDEDTWKCDLDADGNALGGIRLPPIEAPRGVYTGFDYSWLDPEVSKGHRYAMVFAYGGRFERFSDEVLAERYPTRADYKKAFEAAARRAFDAGYILEEDLRRYTAALPRDQFFDSDGVRIRYVDSGPGDAEPILLVHGAAQSIESAWGETGVIDALGDEHRVIALDCRGHGRSDKPHDPRAYGNEMVADLVRLLDHLDIERAHVVGYSMGGRIVAKLVADHPERVISALPCGTNVEPPSPDGRAFVETLAQSLEQTGSIRPALEHFTADGSMTETELDVAVAMIRATNDTKALAAVVRSFDDMIPDRAKLEANAVPCLSIIGARDPNLAVTRTTATYMANLEIEVIEGANHLTAFRDPEFVAAIKDFLGEHAPLEDRYFDSDGVRIRYVDVGPRDGEPVVLLHGFSQRIESAWSDTGVIEALDDEYRVIAMDWRGHGKSDTPHDPEAYGIEIVHDVVRLLDHLQLEKAHVAGYSMGGHITFRLLADHPDRVLSAMPCGDAGTDLPEEFDEVARRAVASLGTSGSIRPLIEYFAAPGSITEDQVMAIVESQRSSNDAAALTAVMQSFRTLDADPAKLAATTVPCLAIIGEHDPFLDGLHATAENMTSLEVRVVEGCDHITVFQSPEYPPLIRSFIDARAGVRAASPNGPVSHHDLAHHEFPEAQAELREVVAQIARDALTGNREGVEAVHLDTDKFTKFGVGQFERQNYAETLESEAAWLGSASDISYEVRDLKIDVFGKVAVVTYYPVASFVLDGEYVEIGGRQTLVFLDTRDGWKIVHEHHSLASEPPASLPDD